MRILYPNSNTSSNIGNAFFYEGVKYALSRIAPHTSIVNAPYPALMPHRLRGVHARNAIDVLPLVSNYDMLLLSGPVLDTNFERNFGPALRSARANGKKIVFLSAGGMTYSDEELAQVRAILEDVRPDVFVSRDRIAYGHYAQYAARSYDGICFAFFCRDYFDGLAPTGGSPYFTMCFDFQAEPRLSSLTGEVGASVDAAHSVVGSHSGKLAYVLDRSRVTHANGRRVMRACHRPMRRSWAAFHRANTICDFNFETYLGLYKHTDFTVTDRLHAAVVTLSFGKPAALMLRSSRSALLDRVGASNVIGQMGLLDLERLAEEKRSMLAWLGEQLAA